MIKAVVREPAPELEKHKYPYIGFCQDADHSTIVLFHKENAGIVLDTSNRNIDIGYYQSNWAEFNFTKLEGDIVLSNS